MYKYYKNNEDNDSRFDEITKEEYNRILKDFEEACEFEKYCRDFASSVLNIKDMAIHITFDRHKNIIVQIDEKGGDIDA